MKSALFVCFLFICFFSQSQEIETFYFEFDKFELVENESMYLEEWINFNRDSKILSIVGSADEKGTNEYNDVLSQKRVDFIIGKIDNRIKFREDFKTLALGESELISNLDAENRKVVIYYLPKKELFLEENIVNTFYVEKKIINLKIEEIEKLQIPEDLTLNEKVNLVREGTYFTLNNIQFDYDSAKLLPSSKTELEKWVEVLEKNEKLKIVIIGHICCVPRDDFNLSAQRAKAVMKYFMYSGISKDRMHYIGYGSSKPKFQIPEKNGYEALQNRRVEILILEK